MRQFQSYRTPLALSRRSIESKIKLTPGAATESRVEVHEDGRWIKKFVPGQNKIPDIAIYAASEAHDVSMATIRSRKNRTRTRAVRATSFLFLSKEVNENEAVN